MQQLDLFGSPVLTKPKPKPKSEPKPKLAAGPQIGDRFRLQHHGIWVFLRRQADGQIVLHNGNGGAIITDEVRMAVNFKPVS